jgi:Skp family chaperone for outer membrane proteins
MKKLLVLAVASVLVCFQASAQNVPQKCGYVNTETILSAIPEYKVATDKLQALGNQYQEAVKKDFAEIEKLFHVHSSSFRFSLYYIL